MSAGLALAAPAAMATDIQIAIGDIALEGTLELPARALGLVMFAHGSGSSRFSPRNRHVAALLEERRLATLLLDLLTVEEERFDAAEATLRFDVDMLAERLIAATDSIANEPTLCDLPLGYFGGSTGAAAALIAAARRPARVASVVSRGGRPDLAGPWLGAVRAPTLLIVGGDDSVVLRANREAARRIAARHQIAVIPGATHLFEERGALDVVAQLAGDWFVEQFAAARGARAPSRSPVSAMT